MINNWYVDSGASSHMTNRIDMLQNIRMISKREILVADKGKLEVNSIGDVKLNLIVDGEKVVCTIKNVLYVPNLCTSLLSVNQLNQQGYRVVFEKGECQIQDENDDVIATAMLKDSMYKLEINDADFALITKEEESLANGYLWHRRLGHISFGNMKFLKERCDNLDIPKCKCITCLKGKQTRDPFKGTGAPSEEPLQLIHSDVVGPMPTESLGGHKYFVTFIDDFSKKIFAFPITRKSDVFDIFVEFKTMAEKQTGKQLKTLRSDNGGEYVNSRFDTYCRENGIIHQKTVPYTPQLNGVAERANRTIMERIRCMLIDSGLEQSFWGEALKTGVYILNVIPKMKCGKSPNELWNGEKDNLQRIRVFGCKAMMHVPAEKRKKLDEKSIECIFVGYGYNVLGYRLFNPKDKKIVVSRDVVFIEDEGTPEAEQSLVINEEMSCGEMQKKAESVPITLSDAITSDDAEKWKAAMDVEYNSLIENGTWILDEAPKDRKIVKCKWVFTTKRDSDGKILRYKARLVAKGFSQESGIDYGETFSPVVRYSSIRLLLALATKFGLNIRQMDAITAFLNGVLTEEIWMEQPEGYGDGTSKCCKLLRAIYGLKQSSRVWNLTINKVLLEFGLNRSVMDQCIYYSIENEKLIIVALYVDDVLIFTSSKETENKIAEQLSCNFKMKDLGEAKSILGIVIERNTDFGTISINQRRYIEDMLTKFGLDNCKTVNTPMDINQKISSEMSPSTDSEKEEMKNIPYRECIGSLLFASQISRPDISYAVNLLSRYCENPGRGHWIAVKRILRYLKGTREYHLVYGQETSELIGYCDADWAGDIDQRKSTTGYLFTYGGGAISWSTKRQPTVALSSTEAEFMSMTAATQEALWLQQLLGEILQKDQQAVKIYCDNRGAMELAKNNSYSPRSKHIDIRHKFIHEKITEGKVDFEHLGTEDQAADILTKACSSNKILKHLPCFGINHKILNN